MDDNLIEIIEEESVLTETDTLLLPVNFITVGEIEFGSVRVYIKQDVYKKIEKFAKEEMSKEVGSILIGDYTEDNGNRTVVISDYIEAKYTDASAATLTFTHETWDYVYKEKDKKYPDKKIVGWQHTHPGYGIFLSSYDIFIQENFFNLPWQIAYVVDQIADTRGFFEWKNDKVSKMTGFYIYDDVGTEIKIVEKAKSKKKSSSMVTVILSLLLAISVLTSVAFFFEKKSVMKRFDEAVGNFDKMYSELASSLDKSDGTATADDVESFRVYVVQEGDYLERICEINNLDYMKNINKIMKINGITNVNKIYAGQKLYLPME